MSKFACPANHSTISQIERDALHRHLPPAARQRRIIIVFWEVPANSNTWGTTVTWCRCSFSRSFATSQSAALLVTGKSNKRQRQTEGGGRKIVFHRFSARRRLSDRRLTLGGCSVCGAHIRFCRTGKAFSWGEVCLPFVLSGGHHNNRNHKSRVGSEVSSGSTKTQTW